MYSFVDANYFPSCISNVILCSIILAKFHVCEYSPALVTIFQVDFFFFLVPKYVRTSMFTTHYTCRLNR